MKKMGVVAVALLMVGVAGGQDEAAKKDLKFMEGTWVVTLEEMGGKKITDEEKKKFNPKLVVKDGKYAVYFGDTKAASGTIKLNAGKKPREIDAVGEEGPEKGKAMPGIYKIDGEGFSVLFTQPGQERPTEFKTKE